MSSFDEFTADDIPLPEQTLCSDEGMYSGVERQLESHKDFHVALSLEVQHVWPVAVNPPGIECSDVAAGLDDGNRSLHVSFGVFMVVDDELFS